VGNDDDLGTAYSRGEDGAGGEHPGEFLLDAISDGLD
jgi:hypothetical protein